MDFMKLFKSLEELLYEVIVMLVFFPKTLWLTLRYPQRMMDYADTELGDVQSEQYNDTLSPPLFLMLCVGLSYMVDRAIPGMMDTSSLPGFLRDAQNMLVFQVLLYSLFPLAFSLRLLFGLGQPVNREELRPPFYSQCFVAAPVTLMIELGQALGKMSILHAGAISAAVLIAVMGWYFRQQVRWLGAKLGLGVWRGWVEVLLISALTFVIFVLVAFLMAFMLLVNP
jgi:hypothetical protein